MRRFGSPPTALIGREQETQALVAQVRGGARLSTLVGLGGVGKSRLALAAAHALVAGGMPVAHVEALGAENQVELVVAIAEACALSLDERLEPVAALVAALAALPPHAIVLDDFEHLAARATPMLERILGLSPTTSFIVTSRLPLDRPAEAVVQVGPLPTAGASSPAVALLRARAGAAPAWHGDDDAVARLAARLDGIPLSLELAAARARVVTPGELLALLDQDLELSRPGADASRSSRDAAVRWSWESLEPDGRRALTALAVVGTFDLDDAAAALDASPVAALAAIEALERVSLVIATTTAAGTRYRVLETVREFAARHGDPAVGQAAWDAFSQALLARIEPTFDLQAEHPPALLARVNEQREHYLACVRRALSAPSAASLERAFRAAVALPLFERLRLPLALAAPFVALFAHPDAPLVPAALRVRAALAMRLFAHEKHGGATLLRELEAAVARWGDALEDRRLRLELGLRRAWDAIVRRDLVGHDVDLELRTLAVALGDDSAHIRAGQYEAVARRMLGQARLGVDDRLLDGLVQLAEARGWPGHVATARVNLAYLCHHLGAPDEALRHVALGRAVTERARLDDMAPYLARERAWAEVERGQLAAAADDFAEAGRALSAIDAERTALETTLDAAALALERGQLARAQAALDGVVAKLETTFEQRYHGALAAALAALSGRGAPPAEADARATGTVEDHAFSAWHAIGSDRAQGALAAAEAVRGHSSRVRQALRLLAATSGLAPPGRAVLVSLDDLAFRVDGGPWVSLQAKPALRTVWRALVEARLDAAGKVVDKAALAALLWPGQRVRSELRDNRLHVNLNGLRKIGLADVVEARDGGYRIAPACVVVRVAPAAFPAPA